MVAIPLLIAAAGGAILGGSAYALSQSNNPNGPPVTDIINRPLTDAEILAKLCAEARKSAGTIHAFRLLGATPPANSRPVPLIAHTWAPWSEEHRAYGRKSASSPAFAPVFRANMAAFRRVLAPMNGDNSYDWRVFGYLINNECAYGNASWNFNVGNVKANWSCWANTQSLSQTPPTFYTQSTRAIGIHCLTDRRRSFDTYHGYPSFEVGWAAVFATLSSERHRPCLAGARMGGVEGAAAFITSIVRTGYTPPPDLKNTDTPEQREQKYQRYIRERITDVRTYWALATRHMGGADRFTR